MKKNFLILGRWVWRVFLAYAIVFSVAGTVGTYLAAKAVWKPISIVKSLRSHNPEKTLFMANYQKKRQETNVPDTLTRIFVPFDSVSPYLVDAVIAAEDDDFYTHPGFDLLAILKAYEFNSASGKFIRGASTITQQMAKNFFLNPEKTFARKYQELLYAVLMENLLGKKRIIELYLNYAQWGPGMFGCEAASQKYFGRPSFKLTPRQSVNLAAVLVKPEKLSPLRPNGKFMQKRINMIVYNLFLRHKKTFHAGGFVLPKADSTSADSVLASDSLKLGQ